MFSKKLNKSKLRQKTKVPIIFVLLLTCYSSTFAQVTDSTLLCRGPYYTEAEGKAALEKFASAYNDKQSWEKRAARIRQNIIDGSGIERFPRNTPLKAVVHSKRSYDGYTVENVYFESFPGFFVTGNLYKPTQPKKSNPVILSVHGHGPDARLKNYMQKRCATLARMGAFVLAIDMVGSGESSQTIHKHPYSLSLQAHNNIRAIDFLLSLPGADSKRVAVTGESGGGTQAILLTALDTRISVSVPVVMVSSYFFGGCVCESGLAIHKSRDFQTSNVEIAALAAPRPMLLISDGKDWTKNTPSVEYPYIKKIYRYYGRENHLENLHLPDEGHDYGISKRKGAYAFLAKHLGLSPATTSSNGEPDENFVTVETADKLQAFDAAHPRPAYAINGDEAVTKLVNDFPPKK